VDWLGFRAAVAFELSPYTGEGRERSVIVESELDDVFLVGLRVQHHFALAAGIAHHGRRIVRKHAGHRRQVADVAVRHPKQGADIRTTSPMFEIHRVHVLVST
jgi:hypothetical protein